MAECLILAIDTGHADDLHWNRGHVVAIMPDGHAWGTEERLPKFWRIIVSGATVAECAAYVDAISAADGSMTKIRGRKFDYNSLSTPQKRTLDRDGYLTVTKAQADAYIASIV